MVKYGKLYPVSFGFAWGLTSGIAWMLLCWTASRWGFGMGFVKEMSEGYMHLAPTFVGGLWGLLWGFIDFFVFGLFFAFVYNCCCNCFCPAGSCDSCE